MDIINKFREHGFIWIIRRITRELINPTTPIGRYLKPTSFFIYYFVSKPINFLFYLCRFQKSNKDCLYFFYDFEVEPVTYDFAWALCIANAKRDQLGLGYLKIIFVPGTVQGLRKENKEYEKVVSHSARNWRVYSILLPIIKLLPCNYGITFCGSRSEALFIQEKQARLIYPEKYNVIFPVPYSPAQAIQYYQTFMSLKADDCSLKYISNWIERYAFGKKTVVITLRQYAYEPARNSNIIAWAQFARAINPEEYFIIFVPDTDESFYEIPPELKGFNYFLPASLHLLIRCALYELAYLNLGVNTGPMSLCWLNSRCRYITFKTTMENVPQVTMEVMVGKGFAPGKGPRFATKFQKWVWDEDNSKIIFKEFEHMCDLIEERTFIDNLQVKFDEIQISSPTREVDFI